jgi:hypothetical protein
MDGVIHYQTPMDSASSLVGNLVAPTQGRHNIYGLPFVTSCYVSLSLHVLYADK